MMRLHGYWRSTAAWRVRIALGLKGLAVEHAHYDLRAGGHRAASYLELNPQGLLPALEAGGAVLTQSLAICEYLDETHPSPPLLPGSALDRARIRAFALAIAADTHPVQNLRVLQRLRGMGVPEPDVMEWARWAIGSGLAACAALLPSAEHMFCFGNSPGLADLCLVPQLYNARRFGLPLDGLERLLAIEAACNALSEFAAAAPDRQADAQ